MKSLLAGLLLLGFFSNSNASIQTLTDTQRITSNSQAYTDTSTALSNTTYNYASFLGFDSSLGDLVSVYLDISSVSNLTSTFVTSRAPSGNTSLISASISADYKFLLNTNIGSAAFSTNIANFSEYNAFSSCAINDSFCSNSSRTYYDISASIDLLTLFTTADFLTSSIGFESVAYTNMYNIICNAIYYCDASAYISANLDLTLRYVYDDKIQVASVPEASSMYLLVFGLLGLFGTARRKG